MQYQAILRSPSRPRGSFPLYFTAIAMLYRGIDTVPVVFVLT